MSWLKRASLALSVLACALLGGSVSADAMICGGGYSQTESNHTVFEHACYEYMFNNSGSARTSGDVVIYDRTGTGVNMSVETSAGRSEVDVNAADGDVDNIGTYITTTTTADSELVAGVIDDDSCADQSYCRVQVRGPRLVKCDGDGDAAVAGDAVGTSATAGSCGDAANDADGTLGLAMQATRGGSNSVVWVIIDPSRTD